jgi:Ca-activated chloride channel homolog
VLYPSHRTDAEEKKTGVAASHFLVLSRIMTFTTRLLILIAAACCLLAGVSTPSQAQQPKPTPPPAQEQQTGKEEIDIRRVRLPITVKDKKGRFIPGLKKQDFQVVEDKVPQEIETFSDDIGQTPLFIGVLMDTSPSTGGKIKFEQEAAMNFIQTIVRPRKDRVFFATFDDQIILRQDFTDRLDLLEKAVNSVKGVGKQTALFDAVWQFCDEKMRSVAGRRVLVVITDGEDTYSRADLGNAIDIAQRTETTIFAISTKSGFLGSVPGVQMGQVKNDQDHDLLRLSEETGGTTFFTGDMLSLERGLNKVAQELRSQYLVTYRSTNEVYNGVYRRIDIKLTSNQNDWKISAKKGYRPIKDSVRP